MLQHLLDFFVNHLAHRVLPPDTFWIYFIAFLSNFLTCLSYIFISVLLFFSARKFEGSLKKFANLFGSFLMLAGVADLSKVVIIFFPLYALYDVKNVLQVACTLVSVVTAFTVARRMKKITQAVTKIFAVKVDLVEIALELDKEIKKVKSQAK